MPGEGPSSVGVSSPNTTQPVRAYRLPTWHWSTWTLQAGGGANRVSDRDETDRFSASLSGHPTYRSFWESETRQAFLWVTPALSVNRNGRSSSPSSNEGETDRLGYETDVRIGGTLREYVAGRTFLLVGTEGRLAYGWNRRENDIGTETETAFNVRTHLRLGVGVGQVRVVTPMIRALRVRERLRAVAPGASVSNERVQTAARQLARRPGYQSVYDRPDKYFWRDLFDRAGLSGRSPFETFYVADVLREPVGVRREGAEVIVGPSGSYDRRLNREEQENRLTQRDLREGGTVGGFARGRWYRNVTLHHQLGADVGAGYTHFLQSEGPVDRQVEFEGEAQWLWVVADRLRLDTRVRADLLFEPDTQGPGTLDPTHVYTFSSDLLFFVENSISFTVGADVRYHYEEIGSSSSRFDAGVRFDVNYVLSRALR